MAKLGDICSFQSGGTPSRTNSEYFDGDIPWITTVALNGGKINGDDAIEWITEKAITESAAKIVPAQSIMVGTRVGVGKVAINTVPMSTSQDIIALINIDDAQWDKAFLCKFIQSKNAYLNEQARGATIKGIKIDVLAGMGVPDVSLNEQQAITQIIDRVINLITLRKQQLAKLDELVKARFIEMFGDPVQNPMGWPAKLLLDMGYCKNGMNFHTGDNGVEMRCLGVGDFKDLSIINGTEHLPIIALNEEPPAESMLQDGDIVFVRSNGNKELVGRCLVVYPRDTPTTYSGFCIRYRMTSNDVCIPYLLRVLKTDSMRKLMAGRGVNIQNLNQQILAALSIPIPPKAMQEQFASFVAQVDKSKLTIQQSLAKMEMLKQALIQKYFE